MSRTDKLSKLVAVYDQFQLAVSKLEDANAALIRENWPKVRAMYAEPNGDVPRSALASGMEQGLRETPMILGSMKQVNRAIAARALTAAIEAHYPDFFRKDEERLEKIRARESIRSEQEFYLVRHHIDVLEGDEARAQELPYWYALVECFEGKA